jgi:tRNA nucleotidyltransferase/poly(A) polymerase
VRDAIRGEAIKDVDLVVVGLPLEKIEKILSGFGKTNLVGESFKVIKFRPEGHTGEDYDVAMARKDKKVGEGHKGFEIVTKGVTIEEDLKRRDFTINSIAINIKTHEVLDPFNGKYDIATRTIKATNPQAFADDPLRILRGIQFAARFNYMIAGSTLDMMRKYAPSIKQITGERIFDEFQKILKKSGNTQIALYLIHETDVDVALFDKKMLKYEEGFEKLDIVSFYYVLALVGDVDPEQFYLKRLKGHADVGKAIKTLDTLIEIWSRLSEEEDKRYTLFKAVQKAPMVIDAVALPPDAAEMAEEMKNHETPMSPSDIKITGDDIKEITKLPEGKNLGIFIEKIQRNALMNKFDWKSHQACVKHVVKEFYH